MKKYIIAFLLLSLFESIAAEPLDKVAAIVNDRVITASEVETQFNIVKQQQLARGEPVSTDKTLRRQVLDHLIDDDLQLQMAKQHHISVDETDLNNAIERIAMVNK